MISSNIHKIKIIRILIVISFSLSCSFAQQKKYNYTPPKEAQVAYFASGCFWCVEGIFESVDGVYEAVSGYAGGHTENPTYDMVVTGRTGHAESVAVYYNPKKVSFQTLVNVFFGSHNPTTINGQYPDFGTQYRSVAFYSNDDEKMIINKTISDLNESTYAGKIVTQVTYLDKFYEAEIYHQDFKQCNPNNSYIKNISDPRLNEFQQNFSSLIKLKN